jgi:DHA1 family bicyclomycin/chloramphenicol resistance-like MFS transporter
MSASFPERAGAVSALVGAIHYGTGVVGSALFGIFADGTPWALGLVVALAGFGSAACAWISQPRHLVLLLLVVQVRFEIDATAYRSAVSA